MATKPQQSYPYHVPQYWMIFSLVKLVHVWKMATWCLHKFPCNAHSQVQQAYLVKGNGTSYVIFGCCWLRTIHAWPISFESFIPLVTLVWGIKWPSQWSFSQCVPQPYFLWTCVSSFQLCACSVLQPLSWISTLTNQFINLKTLLFPKRTNISMPHGKTQLMFMCLGLNVALVEAPPFTNL